MGNSHYQQPKDPKAPATDLSNFVADEKKSTQIQRKYRLLCLHGWRTSGTILSYQTAALCANADIDGTFIDATFAAVGDPDPGIALYYPDMPYYEWFLKKCDPRDPNIKIIEGLDRSISKILKSIDENGPYDGLLGFSSGAAMAAKIMQIIEENPAVIKEGFAPKCVLFIGGVPPYQSEVDNNDTSQQSPLIRTKSLHIMGAEDPYLPKSRLLEAVCDASARTAMVHEEGHNIPSIRTGLYPQIKLWLSKYAR